MQRYISLIVLVLLLAPSLVQLSHVIHEEHEGHEVCISKDEQHFHEYELDCDTCTFHLNNFTVHTLTTIPLVTFTEIISPKGFFYSFKNTSTTSFHLRGPPASV